MSAEHERVAEEIIERWGTDMNLDVTRLIAAALAAASARAHEAGWRLGRREAIEDHMPYIQALVVREYAPNGDSDA